MKRKGNKGKDILMILLDKQRDEKDVKAST